MATEHIQNIKIVVSCPACGSMDYEFEFDSDDIGAEISIPCDECPKRIAVSVDIIVQSSEGGT